MIATTKLNTAFSFQSIKVFVTSLLLISLATGLRLWLFGIDNTEPIWLTFYPAVIISALYAGVYAGIITTLGTSLTVLLWPALFKHTLIENNIDLIELGLFIFIGGFISYAVGALHHARAVLNTAKKEYQITAQREQFLNTIINYMPNMIGYWGADLRCQYANAAFSKWYHKKPEEIVGMSFQELTGAQLFAVNEPYIRAVLEGKPQHFERTLTKTDGSQGNILAEYIPDFDANGNVKGFAIQSSEVTELKEIEAQLKMTAYVFDNTIDGIAITDVNGDLLSVNPAFEEITGYSAKEVLGKPSQMFRTSQHPRKFYLQVQRQIMAKGRWQYDMWSRRKDGDVFLARFTVSVMRDDEGKPARYVSVFTDITDLWRKDEHLKHLAFYDALTDLPNRTLMMERLEQKIIHSKREPCQLALMFIDLDDFKLVNDQLGHNTGDKLLKVIAKRLLDLVRESDTVARLGGDEFIFMLNDPRSKDEVLDVANRILKLINEPFDIPGMTVEVAMSIGVAMYPSDAISADQLIKNADTAMYNAKSLGKNNVCFFADV